MLTGHLNKSILITGIEMENKKITYKLQEEIWSFRMHNV